MYIGYGLWEHFCRMGVLEGLKSVGRMGTFFLDRKVLAALRSVGGARTFWPDVT